VSGKETLILGHPEFGSIGIIREWTDWGAPTGHDSGDVAARRFDADMLLDLADLVGLLSDLPSKNSIKVELEQ